MVKRTWKQEVKRNWPLYVLVSPAIILAIIFCYIPMDGLVMAFQNYKPWLGITGSDFVGMANFKQIFAFQESYQAIINTLIIAVWKIVLGLDGIVNALLQAIGLEKIFFLGEAGMFRQIAVISDLWKGFGFGMIVYLAAISNIDQSLYEAAEMDGANRFQQTLHITLPGMMPIIIVMATLSLGNVLNAGFDQIFNLYSPLTYSTGDIIDTYVYRQSLINGQYSFGTAVGLFKSVIGLILTVISYRIEDIRCCFYEKVMLSFYFIKRPTVDRENCADTNSVCAKNVRRKGDFMRIETERLFLRELEEGDYDALYAVLADSDIMQHYPYTFDEERVRNWITRSIERYEIFGFGLWAVCLKETGEMIGDCGMTMQNIGGVIKPEIGYHIRGDMQRKGYAREAAAAVRDWAFENTPFRTLYSYMMYTNEPSAKTAVSWGCRQVDEFEDEVDGRTKVFAITKDEWKKLQGR